MGITIGADFGRALCAHFGLPAKQVMAGITMNTAANEIFGATLTIVMTADDLAAIAVRMQAVDAYPGFDPVRIKYRDWMNPAPEHMGERILWSDGSAHGAPEDDGEFVTVLRSRDKPPQPPPPPLSRHIREDCGWVCPKCGSSAKRVWLFFGPLKCIHPQCGHEA